MSPLSMPAMPVVLISFFKHGSLLRSHLHPKGRLNPTFCLSKTSLCLVQAPEIFIITSSTLLLDMKMSAFPTLTQTVPRSIQSVTLPLLLLQPHRPTRSRRSTTAPNGNLAKESASSVPISSTCSARKRWNVLSPQGPRAVHRIFF